MRIEAQPNAVRSQNEEGQERRNGQDAPPGCVGVPKGTSPPDAMQGSPLSSPGYAPELDGQEELGPQVAWVSLDAPRGLLVCPDLGLEASEFVGTISESRVVRVLPDGNGGALCASSNRRAADVGRPGRECGPCEDRRGCCQPRWWISWQEEETGRVFAHTLSARDGTNFSRYAAGLRREGLTPGQVLTRLFVEEARIQKTGPAGRRLQFEPADPFRNQ